METDLVGQVAMEVDEVSPPTTQLDRTTIKVDHVGQSTIQIDQVDQPAIWVATNSGSAEEGQSLRAPPNLEPRLRFEPMY